MYKNLRQPKSGQHTDSYSRATQNLSIALDEFRRHLSPDERVQFTNVTPTPDEVAVLTIEIEKKSAERRSRILAARMCGVLEAVQQYSTIVDTITQVNPTAALIWASIKIVVKVM